MVLLGIALSIGDVARHLLHGKVAGPHSHAGVLAAGLGLLISLAYWFGHSFFLSLGYAGTISPAIAPWIIPLFFGVLAVYLYRQIPE
jgi:lipopolysaccharide export LptBFGC system permease protein LptF